MATENHETVMETKTEAPVRDHPSMAFRCPHCHFGAPQADELNNASADRWFHCPQCGHRWFVSPISDS